jgi:hypothetical protein
MERAFIVILNDYYLSYNNKGFVGSGLPRAL